MDEPRGAGRGRGRGMRNSRGRGRGGGGSVERGHSGQSETSFESGNGRSDGIQNRGRGRGGNYRDRGSGRDGRGRRGGNQNGEARHASGGGGDRQRPIGYHILKSWSENQDSEELLIQLANKMESIEEVMMSDSIKEDWYTLLVQAFNTAILCQHHTQKLKKILKAISTTHFLSMMLSNYLDQKQERGRNWTGAEEFYHSIIKIVQQIAKHLPEFAQNCKFPLRFLQMIIKDIEPLSTNHELEELISSVIVAVTKVQKVRIERQAPKNAYCPSSDSDTPPEDFRDLSVIPTISDLSPEVKPFVRAIITKGAYKDQEHYLDIQFRLMREDFIQPLRNGIKDYCEHGLGNKFSSSDIRIYNDVHFTGMTHINGINFVVQFDVSNMKHVKWDHSKRLLNGNLLCLSNDKFKSTLIFATVSFRKTEMLKKGIVNIICHSGLDIVLKTSSLDTFVMAETMAYFEAVHPVLKGLQTIDSDLPLKKYIISCEKLLKPPSYLLGGVRKYDISCMMKTSRNTEVSVLNTSMWPQAENMSLNPSQRDAAILALTKEISVIQGPPGTGKTYVGLKVMQVLLQNQDQMLANDNNDYDPILVICYTNHALDQFLEGILKFCPDGIVRVGGKSSSDALEKFNLVNVKKKLKTDSKAWRYSLWQLRSAIEGHSTKIEDVKKQIECLSTDILKEDDLLDCISPEHLQSLRSGPPEKKKKSKIHQWLNASNKSLLQSLPTMIKHHMTKLVMKVLQIKGRKNVIHFDKDASIIDRVHIYGFWLSQYQNYLRTELEIVQDPIDRNYLRSHYEVSARPAVLNDSEISHAVRPDCLQQIVECFGNNSSKFVEENGGVEAWVLGLHNELNKQLDDVEELTQFIQMSAEKTREDDDDFDDKEETEIAKQNRQFFEEENDEMKNFKATMQVKSEGSFLLNRAKLLGVSEDVNNESSGKNEPQKDEDGFTMVTRTKHYTFSQVKKFLSDEKFLPMKEEREKSVVDLWSLDMRSRFALYKLWIKRHKDFLAQKIEQHIQDYNETKQELTETRMKEDIDVLKQSKVIGMTTTGAAKKRAWLEAIGCRIIVVEEAAEVLEAHIVTALNQNLKHLILIGDHQQLRPNPTVYEHAKNFGLDVSLFERLVNNGIPHVTLSEQHRMRESISVVMRHIYPNLQDHISVKGYEHIRGVSKDIFFIQHDHLEETVKDSMSKSNPFEAEYLIRLCQYFLLQGYEPSQITILATYAGQVFALKKEMNKQKMKHGIRITPVDNFQGEENDIILLSLVRSNKKNIAGFLKVDNRVCVALSRAKKGMFAIGNIKLLASQSPLWKKILETAEEQGITGKGLPISCPNHPDEKNVISVPNDFNRSPEGGCHKKCDFRLDCGHTCHLKCHGYNLEHKDFKCLSECKKTCKEGHPCLKKCWQKCGDCKLPVQKTISACGHTNSVACCVTPKELDCYSQCKKVLPCGHPCSGKCGQCKKKGGHEICNKPVTYFWPCDHAVEVPCHFKPDKNPCPKMCGEVLICGHKCTGKCSDCLNGAIHVACTEKCNKILPCGHKCRSSCSVPCPPCSLPCPTNCRHGPCSHQNKKRNCGDVCIPCQEQCMYGCPHKKCTRKCFAECDVQPCNKPCFKKIAECGHQCSGLCGEICVCKTCDKIQKIPNSNPENKNLAEKRCVESQESDTQRQDGVVAQKQENNAQKQENNAQKQEGNDNNQEINSLFIMLPSCGHIFDLKEIDDHVMDANKKSSTDFICCPRCSIPIQKCWRFQRVVKERAETREKEKEQLKSVHELTDTHRWMISESLRLVQDRDTDLVWFDWRHMKEQVINTAGEFQTVSSKLKFAYVICEILSLEQEVVSSSTGKELKERVTALLKIRNSMSTQQMEEYKVDLKRLLMCRYSDVLRNMAENHQIKFEESRSTSWAKVWRDLKKPKPSESLLEQGMIIINSMEHIIMSKDNNSTLQAVLLLKMNVAKRVLGILKKENNTMLSEILESNSRLKPATASTTRSSIATASASRSSRISSSSVDPISATRSITSSITSATKPAKDEKSHFLNKFFSKMGISKDK